jgi:hypothetical protein
LGVDTHPPLPGRPAKYGNLREDLGQGSSKKYKHADTIQAELNQPGGKRGNGGKLPKLGQEMGQK